MYEFILMRTIITFILYCTFCCLYSQIEKTVDSYEHGVYYGTVSFTIPQYVIADTVIANELDSIFQSHGFSPKDGSKILFSLRTQEINDDSTEYDFFFCFTPCYLEDSPGYFMIRGIDVVIEKDIPPFLKKTKSKKRFTYKRQYYSWVEKGETIEFDISYEDDGSVYTLILKDGHFTVDCIQGVIYHE